MSDRPGIAGAGHHPVVQCGLKLAHVGLSQTTVAGNIQLGSDPDGTPSGRTGANVKPQVNRTISFQSQPILLVLELSDFSSAVCLFVMKR